MTINIGALPVWLAYILMFLGSFCSAVIFSLLIINASSWIKSLTEELMYRHKRKHRFDKPPLAKCYCIDCENWHKDNEKCWVLGRCTGDNWFCQDALPRDKDPDI